MNEYIERNAVLLLFIGVTCTLNGQNNRFGQNRNSTDSNLITVKNWGVSFAKSENWVVTGTSDSIITLMQVSGRSAGDLITINYFTRDSITDNDAKFGWVTYFYDNSSQLWMKKYDSEINPSELIIEKAEVVTKTRDGFPVFSGRSRWKTTIIPLSHKTFLKFNIIGGGETQPLIDMTATLRKI